MWALSGQTFTRLSLVALASLALGVTATIGGCPWLVNDNQNANDNVVDNSTNDNAATNDNSAANTNSSVNDNRATNDNAATNDNTGGTNDNSSTNDNTSANTNDNTGGNTNTNSTTNTNTNSTTNTNTNSTTNTNTNTNSSTNANTNSGGNTNDNSGVDPTPPTSVSLFLIAETGDQVPDQASGVAFTGFGNPIVDGAGRIAFWATFAGTGKKGNGGLYVWNGSELVRVVHDDPNVKSIVPGRTTADYFGTYTSADSPLTLEIAWGGGNRLLFNTPIAGEKASYGVYRWRATDGNIVRVADREQAAALYSNAFEAAFSPAFRLPGVTDGGIALFVLGYSYFTTPPNSQFISGEGVFTSNGLALTTIADNRTSENNPGDVPDQNSDTFWNDFNELTTLNGAGDMLFDGKYTSGDGGRGIYLIRNNTVYRVIDNRTSPNWPGLGAGVKLSGFGGFAISPISDIAFRCQLTQNNVKRDALIIYDFDAANWGEIKGPNGEATTALVSGINEAGQVVAIINSNPYLVSRSARTQVNTTLPASLLGANPTWATDGGAVSNLGRAVIPYLRGSQRGLALWTGQQLLVIADSAANLPAGVTQITTISAPQRDRPGRSGMLNDLDQIVFRAEIAGGSAIYLAEAD